MLNKGRICGILRRLLNNPAITSEQYVENLRSKGIQCGEGTRCFDPASTTVDTQNPHMLKIGKNVRITKGVTILTHDYSWSVLAGVYGECLGGVGSVTIGNNVFIGMHSIILKDTTVGDNVIIGAGSVVKGKVEGNSVYAGVPAKRIMGLHDYYRKKKDVCEAEARNCVQMYKEAFGKNPDEYVLREYFWLFTEREKKPSVEYEGLMKRTGYYEKSKETFLKSPSQYNGYESFIQSCEINEVSQGTEAQPRIPPLK